MSKYRREVLVGLISIIAVVIFFVGLNFLKGIPSFRTAKLYYATFDNMEGITASTPILVNGTKVGVVGDVYFLDKKYNKLVMEISINHKAIKFPEDSKVKIVNINLLGNKGVAIEMGLSEIFLEQGDTIESKIENSLLSAFIEEVTPYKVKFDTLLTSLDLTMNSLRGFITPKNANLFKELLLNLNQTSIGIRTLSDNLNTRVDSLKFVINNTNELLKNLNKVEYKKLSEQFNTTLESVNNFITDIRDTSSSFTKFLKQPEIYDNLNKLFKNMNSLVVDINSKPKKYVHFSIFGRKEKKDK